LQHPGDAWAFDLFSQVGELLRLPPDENPLRGLTAERLLAAGESQSAACLVTYVNAVDAHARVFDGFFVHGRPGTAVSIDGVFIPTARDGFEETTRAIASKGERIRDDVRVPVLVLQSETDVILLGGGRAEQPDSERVRVWELAGAAHADTYTISGCRHDDGTLSGARLAANQRRAPTALRCAGRPRPFGELGPRRGAATAGAAARGRRRPQRLPARRAGKRAWRHPHTVGRRPGRCPLGARPGG